MPPKRKRAETGADHAGPSTRTTRKSTRTARGKRDDSQDNISVNFSSVAVSGGVEDDHNAPSSSKKTKLDSRATARARGRGARAVQNNNDRPIDPSTNLPHNDHALEDIKQASLKVPASDEYSPKRSHDLFKNFADADAPNVVGPEGVEKLCTTAGIPLDGAQPLILAWQFGCTEVGKITLDEWVHGTDVLRISSLPALALALRELDDLVVHNRAGVKKPPTSTSSTKRGADSKVHIPYNRSRYWDYAQNSQAAFNELYQFCFTLSKPPQSRNIDMETATALWSVLLTARYPIISEITMFLHDNGSYRGANKDIWSMVYEFCRTIHPNLDNYETDGAWPTMLDDFVSWKRGKASRERTDS